MIDAGKLSFIAWILVMIGGINWLFIGLLNWNIVGLLFGMSFLARLVYIIVGISACYLIYLKIQKNKTQ